jgi:hypothetical protein
MPEAGKTTTPKFLHRHSSLWEKPSEHLDSMCEDDGITPETPWETSRKAPVTLAFRPENMPEGGEAINPINGHPGSKDEDLPKTKGSWIH